MHEKEVYFSNHYDCVSANTVIRRCYVLTYNHFCRLKVLDFLGVNINLSFENRRNFNIVKQAQITQIEQI